jgi:deoxyribodipyrimidine photo-lyase
MKSPILVWFRNDLRLHDHEALNYAIQQGQSIIPVYVIDDRQFQKTHYFDLPKTSAFRAQFLLEALQDLKQSLIQKGSDLIIRKGLPEQILPELCKQYLVKELVYHKEALDTQLIKTGVEPISFSNNTLVHHDDLPFPLTKIPAIFTKYRIKIESECAVRPLFAVPAQILSPEFQYVGALPTLDDLGLSPQSIDTRSALIFKGGETEALHRLNYYLWDSDFISTYESTRNGMLGGDYSSKFSAWLALGCISAKYIYHEIQAYELQRQKNKSTYWLIFELYWRDFFKFTAQKYFKSFFSETGVYRKTDCDWKIDNEKFERWKTGTTGFPFIDANMRELNASGFMSNRGRQIVASFLVKDLKVNWIMGAEYFESLLIDYDVTSNYGNWAYVAGVGQDPRENRHFNIFSQAARYDTQALFMKHWLPELNHLDTKIIQTLHTLDKEQRMPLKITDYPLPIIKAEMIYH